MKPLGKEFAPSRSSPLQGACGPNTPGASVHCWTVWRCNINPRTKVISKEPREKRLLSVRFSASVPLTFLLSVFLIACSSRTPQNPIDTPLPPSPTLPPPDAALLVFEEGKHNRDEACGRVFSVQQTVYGPLTIAIAENFIEPQDVQVLAGKVIDLYHRLYTRSSIPLIRPLSVFLLPDPDNGQCYSRDNLVFATPEELDSRSFLEQLLGAGTGSREYWILNGQVSLLLGEEPGVEILRRWYEETNDLDIAGLFFAYFQEDWASAEEIRMARMSAASLLEYALNEEHIPADRLAEQVDNQVRTRWLASLGVQRTVTYPYDGRFTDFTYYGKGDCSLNIRAGNILYCLDRLSDQEYFDQISEVEFFLNQTYYGRLALEEYLFSEAPSIRSLMDPEEMILYAVAYREPGDRRALGYTNGNSISINQSAVFYYPLHEIVHTFNWNSVLGESSVMLSEGFAEYLGKLLPLYVQTEQHCIFQDLTGAVNGAESIAPGTSYCYSLDPEQLDTARQWYLAQGGRMDAEEEIDPRLFVDAVAFATMVRDAYAGSRGVAIGEKYAHIPPGSQDGLELSTTQAASFVGWLCETYTMDRVLDVYVNRAEDRLLDGKTYEDLKSAWLASLISRGEGIAIPDSSVP